MPLLPRAVYPVTRTASRGRFWPASPPACSGGSKLSWLRDEIDRPAVLKQTSVSGTLSRGNHDKEHHTGRSRRFGSRSDGSSRGRFASQGGTRSRRHLRLDRLLYRYFRSEEHTSE